MSLGNILQMRFKQLIMLFKILLGFLFSRGKREDIWLISERGHEARDNGFVFYQYMKKKHPEQKVRYIIDKSSCDKKKFDSLDDLVYWGTLQHSVIIWKASHLISTHILGYTEDSYFFIRIEKIIHIFRHKKKVFLQHGIIKDDIPALYGNMNTLDLFVCGAKLEFDYVQEHYQYPEGVIKYTGLCRYDNLMDYSTKRQILLMPTWRNYIKGEKFQETNYYKTYLNLLRSPKLQDLLRKYNFTLAFYLHYEVQKYITLFQSSVSVPRIAIIDSTYDVQQLLKESDMLITDYSSVYFDMAYMRKAIIMYQFDEEAYRRSQYQRGYFYESSIGDVVYDQDSLLQQLEDALERNCKMKVQHEKYIDEFFIYHDKHNCERVYQAIKDLG